jgi:hypothetical protein
MHGPFDEGLQPTPPGVSSSISKSLKSATQSVMTTDLSSV